MPSLRGDPPGVAPFFLLPYDVSCLFALLSRLSPKNKGINAGCFGSPGRFGINAQLITPSGCAGRLGSLVTDADLGNSFMIDHQELCLHKAGQNCLKFIGRCPVGAIGEDGIDRHRCFARLKVNINHTKALAGLEETTHVCGKCVVNLPCSIDPLGQQT